jgi:hypothetical protein
MTYCPSERLIPRIVARRKPATSPVSNEQNRQITRRRQISTGMSAWRLGSRALPPERGPRRLPVPAALFFTYPAFETETMVGEWGALIAAVEVQSVVDASFKEPLQQAAAQTFR